MDDWMFHHRVVMRTLGIYQAFKEERPAQDEAKLRGFLGADPRKRRAIKSRKRLGGPTSIEVATAKTGIDFAATESGSAGGLSRVLVSDELGADVASIARFDRDNGWHTLLGDTRMGTPWTARGLHLG
jgi:hypothetical protein